MKWKYGQEQDSLSKATWVKEIIDAVGRCGLVSCIKGALMHIVQRRRRRLGRFDVDDGFMVQFLQTIRLHRRHSPTISRAHGPTLPLVMRREGTP